MYFLKFHPMFLFPKFSNPRTKEIKSNWDNVSFRVSPKKGNQ